MGKMAKVCISLPPEQVEELRRISRQTGKSISLLVREAIAALLMEQRRRQVGERLLAMIQERPRASGSALAALEDIRGEWERL